MFNSIDFMANLAPDKTLTHQRVKEYCSQFLSPCIIKENLYITKDYIVKYDSNLFFDLQLEKYISNKDFKRIESYLPINAKIENLSVIIPKAEYKAQSFTTYPMGIHMKEINLIRSYYQIPLQATLALQVNSSVVKDKEDKYYLIGYEPIRKLYPYIDFLRSNGYSEDAKEFLGYFKDKV